ncbi:unnamed protein product [Scytosiphon promiscuus]
MPPPIPSRKEESRAVPPPIPSRDEERVPSSPVPSPVRRPAGAVATVMASGLPSAFDSRAHQYEEGAADVDDQPHGNPYDLKAEPGSTVTASYPFQGEESLEQLSFAVGDRIKIKQKEEMWSWGILERGGKEGWFPHNYVGSTFMPLPGIHEMAAKLRERREKQDAEEARSGAVAAPDDTKEAGARTEAATDRGADEDVNGTGDPSSTATTAAAAAASAAAATAAAACEDASSDHAASRLAADEPESGIADVATDDSATTDANSDPQKVVAPAAAMGGSPKPPSSSSHQTGAKGVPQASSAPSLPPFSKGTATLAGATAVPTQQVAGDTSSAAPEQGTQIDGVGFEGAPPNASSSCRCCIM